MKKRTQKQIICAILCVVMLLGIAPMSIFAVDVGDTYVPDMGAWGTQNNNGWYYMYKDPAGAYHEMNFYATSDIGWQVNAFASDPYTMGEMFFITQNTLFVGELGSRPVYAFKAPVSGEIELSTLTHSTDVMRMQVFVNDQLQQINGQDSLTLTTTGTLAGGMTETKLVMEVAKDDMVYVEFYSTDMAAQRQVWTNGISVKYRSVKQDLTGVTLAPDANAWGTQGSNGWYYMYKDPAGAYKEMNFYTTSDIGWQANNYASDPYTMGEMFFITQGAAFVGELGSRPVYAFKAPESGEIELAILTHSTDVMRMQVYVGNQLQQINGQDSLTLTTAGTLPGGMTETKLVLNVTKGDMVYVEFYSTDINAQRQIWTNGISVTYRSVKQDLTGAIFAPDMSAWGTQGNNGWYYMFKDGNGFYNEMGYYDETSTIDWQKNSYASDPFTQMEMFFINKDSFFTGELGSRPVYAFKAPVGGKIKLHFETHGTDDMYAQVYVGNELQTINGADRVAFNTTGELAGFTATELTLDVKQNTMVYIVGATSGANRQGWLRNYTVEYLAVNEEVDYTSVVYAPDMDNWGIQNNNGWYYMFKHGNTGLINELNWYDSTAEIDWQKNNYAFDPYTMGEMLFIDPTHYFSGELGSSPVYAFKAPVAGTLEFYFEMHGLAAMGASAYVNDKLIQIDGQDRISFRTDGSLPGAHVPVRFTAEVEAGDMVYIVCSSTDAGVRDGWFRNQKAQYLSVKETIDYTGVTLTPDMGNWGAASNNSWSYAYLDKTTGKYIPLNYFDNSAAIDWQKNAYSIDPGVLLEMLFINQNQFFVGELGSRPAYVFTAPVGGKVEFTVHTHGLDKVFMEVYCNDEKVSVNGQEKTYFNTTGPLAGFTAHTFTLDVKKGTTVYLVGGSDNYTDGSYRAGFVNYYGAKYLSTNDEVEIPEEEIVQKVEGDALTWNKTQEAYAKLQEKLASNEPMTWLFVGDSITANDGDFSRGYRNYTEIFESYLKNALGRVNDRVVNTAVSGWKISNINYERDIAAYNPDVVYVKIGTNDTFLTDYAADNFVAAMNMLYGKIVDSGAIPVIACANGFSSKWTNVEQTEAFAQRYPDAIRTIAFKNSALLVDYYAAYAADSAKSDAYWFTPDTIHPNRAGLLFHAQTLIKDLGFTATSPILSQNAADLSGCEVPDMTYSAVEPKNYWINGTALELAKVDLSKGFVMIGGSNAIGASDTFITTRAIHQYLAPNNQLGLAETLYAGPAAIDYSAYAAEKIIFLMPEALGVDGNALWTAEAVPAAVDAAVATGRTVVLITPAPTFGESAATTEALAKAVLDTAKAKGLPVIDLYGYLSAVYAEKVDAKTLWNDGNVLNYSGANEAAMFIGGALGMDAKAFSDDRIVENFNPDHWGKQDNNGFSYYYQAKTGGDYLELPFIPAANASQVWLKDRFGLAPEEYCFIGEHAVHAGANYNPVQAFTVPYTGTIRLTLKHLRVMADVTEGGTNGTIWLKAYLNDTVVNLDGDNAALRTVLNFSRFTTTSVELEVKKGDVLYIVVDAEQPGQIDLLETITYLSIEEAPKTYIVTWNVNGTITTETYEEGTMPSFKGDTAKAADKEYTYTFAGWDKTLAAVTGDVTYTATYTAAPIQNADTADNSFLLAFALLALLSAAGVALMAIIGKRKFFM